MITTILSLKKFNVPGLLRQPGFLYLDKYDKVCYNYTRTYYKGNNLEWTKARKLARYGDNTFEYNASGLRVRKNDKYYILDGDKILRETDYNGTITYYYGNSGVIGFNYNDTDYYYRKNILGDVLEIYTANGVKVASYAYDAWGNHEITLDTNNIGTINPIRYRGYYFDTETGLYYLQTRYYDPEIGRFINADAIEFLVPNQITGLNLYSYCNNNPVMDADSNGCIGFLTMLAIGAVVGLIVGGVSSVVTQAAENDWDWNSVDARVVAVDAVFGAIDGALSTTGIGTIASIILNPVLSGAQTITTAMITNDMDNLGEEVGFSMVMGAATAFIPGGYNGRKLSGIYKTSSMHLRTVQSAAKRTMYRAKQKAVNKVVIASTAEYVGSSFFFNFATAAFDPALGG